jgi:Protein of unknown function (DUF4242)
VPQFLVETYASVSDPTAFESDTDRARCAAEQLTREGIPVTYVRSILIPEDDTCFHLYEARSAEAVREVTRRAGLTFERLSEAITEPNRP